MLRYNEPNYFPPGVIELNGGFAIVCQNIINDDDVIYWSGVEWDEPRLAKMYKSEKEALKILNEHFPAN